MKTRMLLVKSLQKLLNQIYHRTVFLSPAIKGSIFQSIDLQKAIVFVFSFNTVPNTCHSGVNPYFLRLYSLFLRRQFIRRSVYFLDDIPTSFVDCCPSARLSYYLSSYIFVLLHAHLLCCLCVCVCIAVSLSAVLPIGRDCGWWRERERQR